MMSLGKTSCSIKYLFTHREFHWNTLMQAGYTFSFRNEFRETSATLHFVIMASELNDVSHFRDMVPKKPCPLIDVNNEIV